MLGCLGDQSAHCPDAPTDVPSSAPDFMHEPKIDRSSGPETFRCGEAGVATDGKTKVGRDWMQSYRIRSNMAMRRSKVIAYAHALDPVVLGDGRTARRGTQAGLRSARCRRTGNLECEPKGCVEINRGNRRCTFGEDHSHLIVHALEAQCASTSCLHCRISSALLHREWSGLRG